MTRAIALVKLLTGDNWTRYFVMFCRVSPSQAAAPHVVPI